MQSVALSAGTESASLRRLLSMTTICVSAALLFSVQLLFVKMVLPLFGGTPAVWNTAVLFFQCVLLLGYFYVHLMRTYLGLRGQVVLHLALMLLACVALPVRVMDPAGRPDTGDMPILGVLAILTSSIGLPFFVLSATSPLLQYWLTQTHHQDAKDPYFLYAASNVGSMLGLFAYPFVLEPLLGLRAQSSLWSGGYLLLVGLLSLSAFSAWKDRRDAGLLPAEGIEGSAQSPSLSARLRLRWVLFACIPSSLMLGVTTYLSSAIAPIPMLWMIPLATYLLTLILAFSRQSAVSKGFALRIPALAALALAVCMPALHASLFVLWFIWLHVTIQFVLSLTCHTRLAEERPGPEHLTEFYLWLSVGGALGGVFNALIAPVIFSNVLEYPLALCAAVACERMTALRSPWKRKIADAVFFCAVAVDAAALAAWFPLGLEHVVLVQRIVFGIAVAACFASMSRPRRLGLSLAALFAISAVMQDLRGESLLTERNFFGVKEVAAFKAPDAPWVVHRLIHNGTVHGTQIFDSPLSREPLGYYGPFGDLIATLRAGHALHEIAVVGLGVGTLACFAQPAERWTFYEIDPEILRIARDPRYFSYLSSCTPGAEVVIGDARISLHRDARPRYDLMVLDAYSSDQMPVHLMTREALSVYRENLSGHGVLAFHISNRSFDLRGVLGNLAADAGLTVFIRTDLRPIGKLAPLKFGSVWVVMARSASDLGALPSDERWHPLPSAPDLPLWTDDYSSLLRVLKWR